MWNFSTGHGLSGHAAPFSFPLRALTVDAAPNVLVAGKTAALTFAANTAARVHTGEWNAGVGSGAAAALMAKNSWTTTELFEHVTELQTVLRSPSILQPLVWS